jgi:antitoxin HicB
LDDSLAEKSLLAEAEVVVWKRVIAFQIARSMEEQNMTKAEMARRMKTSRAAVDRLLDPENESATLVTLEKAALAVGKQLQVALVQP